VTPPVFSGVSKAGRQGAYWDGKEKRRERKCKKLRVIRYIGRPTRIAQLRQGGSVGAKNQVRRVGGGRTGQQLVRLLSGAYHWQDALCGCVKGACHLVAARSQHARERASRPLAHAMAGDIKLLGSEEPPGKSKSCCQISVLWVGTRRSRHMWFGSYQGLTLVRHEADAL